MGDQEGDVEAAGEEAGVQQQVAAVLHRPDHGVLQTGVGLGMFRRRRARPGQLADQRQGGQGQQLFIDRDVMIGRITLSVK